MEQYPRMLHKPDGSKCLVQDAAAEHTAVADGWQLHATPPPPPARSHAHDAPKAFVPEAPKSHEPPAHSPEPPDKDEARKPRR